MKRKEIQMSTHIRLANIFGVLIAVALLITVATTNIVVLLLLLAAPFAWVGYELKNNFKNGSGVFLSLILAFCAWDVFTNIYAGNLVGASLKELLHHVRTFGFIVLLWALFANQSVSRSTLWALIGSAVVFAALNLVLTLTGYLHAGDYFMPSISHLYGQVLVGCFFILAQVLVARPQLTWRVLVPMLILLASLVFASHRRTGYVLLAAGFLVWALLNKERLFGKYRWWFVTAAGVAAAIALSSSVVQERMLLVVAEVQQFVSQTPQERVSMPTSVGIRLQYYMSVWDLITQSNWLVGVGSIQFPELFWQMNEKLGGVEKTMFSNPHNEYLYILATKGVVGLALYLAIFVQACRVAWQKDDQVQRIGLLVFVFLFLLSVTSNSMMIDMEEGHFMMLILLIFLAPTTLNLFGDEEPSKASV
jgi:O-antigen ligase